MLIRNKTPNEEQTLGHLRQRSDLMSNPDSITDYNLPEQHADFFEALETNRETYLENRRLGKPSAKVFLEMEYLPPVNPTSTERKAIEELIVGVELSDNIARCIWWVDPKMDCLRLHIFASAQNKFGKTQWDAHPYFITKGIQTVDCAAWEILYTNHKAEMLEKTHPLKYADETRLGLDWALASLKTPVDDTSLENAVRQLGHYCEPQQGNPDVLNVHFHKQSRHFSYQRLALITKCQELRAASLKKA